MSKAVRNILIVAMILGTGFVLMICLGLGINAQNDIYYDLIYDAPLEIVDVKLEKIGEAYNENGSKDGKSYYQMDILLKNDTNVTARRYGTSYSVDVENGYAATVYIDAFFDSVDEYVIPAGGQGKVTAIVQIPDQNKTIEVYTWQDKDVRFEAKLP